MGRRVEVVRQRARDPLDRELLPEPRRDDPHARAAHGEVASRGGRSRSPNRTRSEAARPFRSSVTPSAALLALRADERAEPRRGQGRDGVARTDAARPVEQPLDRRRGRLGLHADTTGRAGTTSRRSVDGRLRRPRLSAPRSTPVPERASTTAGSRRRRPPSRRAADRRSAGRAGSPAARRARARAGTSSGTSGPPPSPSRARTRFAVPPSRPPRAPRRAPARRAAPHRSWRPPALRAARSDASAARAAASLTAVRASSSLRPPTGTPPIVVPRGRLSRSSRATTPTRRRERRARRRRRRRRAPPPAPARAGRDGHERPDRNDRR